MADLDAFQPPCCNSNPMVYLEPHDRLGDPQSRGFWHPRAEIPKPMKPYHRRWYGRCKLSDHTWAAYPTVRRCPTLCISLGGGGLGGRGALPEDNTPAQRKTPLKPPPPPTPPPFLIWLWGVFKHDIQFPRTPPPPLVEGVRGGVQMGQGKMFSAAVPPPKKMYIPRNDQCDHCEVRPPLPPSPCGCLELSIFRLRERWHFCGILRAAVWDCTVVPSLSLCLTSAVSVRSGLSSPFPPIH